MEGGSAAYEEGRIDACRDGIRVGNICVQHLVHARTNTEHWGTCQAANQHSGRKGVRTSCRPSGAVVWQLRSLRQEGVTSVCVAVGLLDGKENLRHIRHADALRHTRQNGVK